MKETPLRVLFLTPYFRPYLGGIERAIEQLSFKIMESDQVEAVAVLTTKYAFPRVPHPEWADRDTTPEGIGIYRLKAARAAVSPNAISRRASSAAWPSGSADRSHWRPVPVHWPART